MKKYVCLYWKDRREVFKQEIFDKNIYSALNQAKKSVKDSSKFGWTIYQSQC